jgi:hypothetical protein
MKKEWQKPELEVLDVSMTMLDPNGPNSTDASFPAGTDRKDFTYS